MGHGDDRGPQKVLGYRVALADGFHLRLEGKDVVQGVFQLGAEIVVGFLGRVLLLLEPDHQPDVLHGHHRFGHGDEEQIADLLPGILLLHRAGQQALLHIVADHGPGEGHVPQGGQIFRDIFGGLLQIQPHVGDLLVPGQTEIADLILIFLPDRVVHRRTSLSYFPDIIQ